MAHWQNYPTRHVGDANPNRPKHLHDLANEQESCVIHSLEWASNAVPFSTREEAYRAGYKPCVFCLPYERGAS